MKLWERLGFKSRQHYTARVRTNGKRIEEINGLLEDLGWFRGASSEEGDELAEEKDRLTDEVAPIPNGDELAGRILRDLQ